jgi:HAD superfamily hydrolase (TIGR01509 family)
MLEQLLPKDSQDTRQRLLKAQGELYEREFIGRAQPFPGVRRLIEGLERDGVLIGLATTCQKGQLDVYDERMDILSLTDVVACGESVKHGKPDTSLFQHCLEAMKIDPADAVAVGDTPYDAIAARQLKCASLVSSPAGSRSKSCESLVVKKCSTRFNTFALPEGMRPPRVRPAGC